VPGWLLVIPVFEAELVCFVPRPLDLCPDGDGGNDSVGGGGGVSRSGIGSDERGSDDGDSSGDGSGSRDGGWYW